MPAAGQDHFVTSSATFLGLLYPGRGLERSIRKEHINNMTSEDYKKVWRVSSRPSKDWQGSQMVGLDCQKSFIA
jgi:hypothetical protein